jgi:hypothetical protein
VCTQQGALQGENGVRAHSSQACPSAAGGWPGLAGSALEATHGQSSHGPIMMWPRKQKRLLPGHSLYSILRGCIIPAAPSTSSSSPLFADVGESNAASSPTLPPLAGKRGIATLSHQSPPTTSRGSHQAGASSQPGVISSASMRATQPMVDPHQGSTEVNNDAVDAKQVHQIPTYVTLTCNCPVS